MTSRPPPRTNTTRSSPSVRTSRNSMSDTHIVVKDIQVKECLSLCPYRCNKDINIKYFLKKPGQHFGQKSSLSMTAFVFTADYHVKLSFTWKR